MDWRVSEGIDNQGSLATSDSGISEVSELNVFYRQGIQMLEEMTKFQCWMNGWISEEVQLISCSVICPLTFRDLEMILEVVGSTRTFSEATRYSCDIANKLFIVEV